MKIQQKIRQYAAGAMIAAALSIGAMVPGAAKESGPAIIRNTPAITNNTAERYSTALLADMVELDKVELDRIKLEKTGYYSNQPAENADECLEDILKKTGQVSVEVVFLYEGKQVVSDAAGTATLLNGGYMLTAAHVININDLYIEVFPGIYTKAEGAVKKSQKNSVMLDGKKYGLELLASNNELDYAIMKVVGLSQAGGHQLGSHQAGSHQVVSHQAGGHQLGSHQAAGFPHVSSNIRIAGVRIGDSSALKVGNIVYLVGNGLDTGLDARIGIVSKQEHDLGEGWGSKYGFSPQIIGGDSGGAAYAVQNNGVNAAAGTPSSSMELVAVLQVRQGIFSYGTGISRIMEHLRISQPKLFGDITKPVQ